MSLFWLSANDWIVKRGTGENWEGAFAFQVSTFKSLLAAALLNSLSPLPCVQFGIFLYIQIHVQIQIQIQIQIQ